MSRRVKLSAAVVAIYLGAYLVAVAPANALDKSITVTGEASLAIAPDVALIRAGVMTRGKTAHDTTDTNSKQMTAVLAALKAQNIAEQDIQTSRLSIQPTYEQNRSAITGFQTVNQMTVKLHDLTQISAVLDKMIAAGVNEVGGIEFMVAEPSKALDKVRADAIKDAQRKAAIYAEAAGEKLGRARNISEEMRGGGRLPVPMGAQRAAAMPVAPGEETLRAGVTVTFDLQM